MRGAVAFLPFAAALGACAGSQSNAAAPPPIPLSVYEVVRDGRSFLGQRILIEGVLIECQPLSCGLVGEGPDGESHYLSLGGDAQFDEQVNQFAGGMVTVQATVTDSCFPHLNAIVLCTDRPSTLDDPVLIPIVRTN